jgi:hypothetical protein
MPDFVEGLRDIKECSGAICLVLEGFVNPANDAMRLFDGVECLRLKPNW